MPDQAPLSDTTPNGPSRLSSRDLRAAQERCLANGPEAERQLREQEAEDAQREAEKRAMDIDSAARRLWAEWGPRYQECELGNFRFQTDFIERQEKVLGEVTAYGGGMHQYLRQDHMGLVLVGPPGTGKDHLFAALAKGALALGLTIKWTSGLRLFQRTREDIHHDRSEAVTTKMHVDPDLLILSDPSFQKKPLTDYQKEKLGLIVDERHNRRKPIWVSINADGPGHAEQLLGGPLVDRLRDGALSLPCNWPSYRKSITTLLGPDRRFQEDGGST